MNPPNEILEEFSKQRRLLEAFRDKLNSLIKDLLHVDNINPHQIVCRLKERESLAQKIERKKDKYSALNDITDIVGIRIITYFEDDVDKIAKIIEQEFEIDRENSIDKRVLEVDRFGYQSLHYVVSINEGRFHLAEYKIYKELKAEIQVRSILQHAWAEIEHDIGYKGEVEIPRFAKRSFSRIAALLETADIEFVKLKETLKEYEKDVTKIIETTPEDVLLDKVSVSNYINTSNVVQEIEEEMARVINVKRGAEPSHLGAFIERVQYFGVSTIKQLDELFKKYKKAIPIFYREMHRGKRFPQSEVYKGLSIFFLAYVLATRNESAEEFKKYYLKFFNRMEEGRAEKFLEIYKTVKKEAGL